MKGAPVTATLDEKCAMIRKNGLSGFSMVAMGWLARNTVTSVFARDIASISVWRLGWRDWKDLSLKTGVCRNQRTRRMGINCING